MRRDRPTSFNSPGVSLRPSAFSMRPQITPTSVSLRGILRLKYPCNFSLTTKRRFRCGPLRGRPVVVVHLSPGLAPQVGQGTSGASSFLSVFTAIFTQIALEKDGQY